MELPHAVMQLETPFHPLPNLNTTHPHLGLESSSRLRALHPHFGRGRACRGCDLREQETPADTFVPESNSGLWRVLIPRRHGRRLPRCAGGAGWEVQVAGEEDVCQDEVPAAVYDKGRHAQGLFPAVPTALRQRASVAGTHLQGAGTQVHIEVLRPWITKKVTQYCGFEDDIVINMAIAELEKVGARLLHPRCFARFHRFPCLTCLPACACKHDYPHSPTWACLSVLLRSAQPHRAVKRSRAPCTFSPTCELAVADELVLVCFPQEDEPDPRRMQVNLTGFLERNAGANCVQARKALFMLTSVLMLRELQGPSWASCGICASRPKRTSK